MKPQRVLAALLTFAILLSMFGNTGIALAIETNASEHVHDENCGYIAAVEGHACEHVHDESCGHTEGTPETACDLGCVETDDNGVIDHAEDCAYRPAVAGMPCNHVHDSECGYVEAVAGQPCNAEAIITNQEIELTDAETKVTVKGFFLENTALKVTPLTKDGLIDLGFEEDVLISVIAFDIIADSEVQSQDEMTISLPIPENFTGDLSVRFFPEGKEAIDMRIVRDDENCVVRFTANSFGIYALIHTPPVSNETPTDIPDGQILIVSDQAQNEIPNPSSLGISTDEASGVQYSDADRPVVMSLLETPEGLAADMQSDGAWSFGLYYINYAGALATTKNDTTLDLVGNSSKTKQTVKYQFEFHNNTDYEAGTVSFALPHVLLTDRDGKAVTPSDIGVPMAPAVSRSSPFHYTVEKIDGVEYMVFTNHKKIVSGSNNLIQVFYQVDDMKTIDGTAWDIQAKITVNGSASMSDAILHGSMDTKTSLYQTSKEAYAPYNSNIYPELYTWNQVKQWSPLTGDEPADFNDYRYILWKTDIQGAANQPWNLTIKDTPSHDGEVIGQLVFPYQDYPTVKKPFAVFGSSEFAFENKEQYVLTPNSQYFSAAEEHIYVYSLVRYPISSFPEDCKVSNHIEAALTGIDDKITTTLTSDAEHVWEDYNWIYLGDLFSVEKGYGNYQRDKRSIAIEEAWIDAYAEAANQGTDLPLPKSWDVYGYARGYSYIQNDAEGSYKFVLIDDVQYIKSNQGNYTLLTPDDYHYGEVVFGVSENNIDIYEDKVIPAQTGADFSVYVMAADDPGIWQFVSAVPFSEFDGYRLSDEWINKGVYSVKVEHEVACYETGIHIQGQTVLHHESERIAALVADEANTQLDVMNIAGGYAEADGVDIFFGQPHILQSGGNIAQELAAKDMAEYGGYLYRFDDFVRLTRLSGKNDARKTVSARNNPVDSRVDLTYTLAAWDGYEVYDDEAVEIFRSLGITPSRSTVTMYDLLPLGVVFNPSKGVSVGQIRYLQNMNNSASWNTDHLSIDWNVIDDYRGSGRQMVAFTLTYTGEPDINDRYEVYMDLWYCGWGVSFDAYYSWEDYALANTGVNVMAFATDTPIHGAGYIDNGTGVPTAAGTDSSGQSYFYDPENDGVADKPYLIYATVANNDDVAVAAKANIEKLVKADSDLYSEPALDATVQLGGKYTYTLQVNNAQGKLKGIVIYDHLEQGQPDHSELDTRPFDESYWQGAFAGVSTVAARIKGAKPVVYYSANSNQAFDLTTDGWVAADQWTGNLAEVKSVAVDLTQTPTGDDFILDELDSIKILVKMTAPVEVQTATYAYNVPVFDSISIADDGNESTQSAVMGNSTAVSLYDPTSLVVEKHITPDENAPTDAVFEFSVTVDRMPYASREYRLIGADGAALPGIYATDTNGVLKLKAGQKAVFRSMPAGKDYSVTEAYRANWEASPSDTISGTFVSEEEAVVSFTNTFKYLLYFDKYVEYEQDYSKGNDTNFMFRLTINSQVAANLKYALVDASTPAANEPAILENDLTTDSEGVFTLKAGQRAMFSVDRGAQYRFEEINIPSDYTCAKPVAEGTLNNVYAQAFITNQYKYKDLYVSKSVHALEGITPDANAEFAFVLNLDGGARTTDYILYELQTNAEAGETEYVKIGTGATPSDGTFSLKAGQQIRFIRIPAGTAYEVTEIDSPDDLFEISAPQTGVITGKLPTYAPNSEAKFVNESLLRTLTVSKTVIATSGVSDKNFTFTLMLNGEIAAEQPYTLKTDGAVDTQLTTGTDGTFTLNCTQTAVFGNLPVGTGYSLHEIPLDGFVQLAPANGADASGTLPAAMKVEAVSFVNQDENAENLLVVRKAVISDVPGLAEASLYGSKRVNGEVVYTYGNGEKYPFHIEVNGVPYANGIFIRVSADGSIKEEQTTNEGDFNIRATDTVIFHNLSVDDAYAISEHAQGIWDRTSISDPVTGELLGKNVKWAQVNPADGASVEGVINGSENKAQITNKLTANVGLNIEKTVNGDNVWHEGDHAWGDVKGKIIFRLQLRDKDGNIITGPDTYYYQQYGDQYDQNCRPDENGYFEMWIDTTVHADSWNDYYGELDGYIPAGYDIKIEEVRTEPENLFGTFTGLRLGGPYEIDEDGFILMPKNHSGIYMIFANTSATKPYQVYKELEGVDAQDTEQDFQFTLYSSQPFIARDEWDDTLRKWVPVYEESAYEILADEPFTRFDAATGTMIGTDRTDENGKFTLKAGQYVQFEGKLCEITDGYYDFNMEEAQTHYKVVETPYSDYAPQVTIDKNGTTSVTTGSNTGTIIAGQKIHFLNTHQQSASLVVTKTVTSRDGITAPKDDTFAFKLTVDGKAYGNQEYRRFGKDGAELFNVQIVNGFETTLPWATSRFGEFVLEDGERAVFDWVGEGRQYEITETTKDGYTQITPAMGTGISDVVTANGSVASFVNLYEKNPPSDGTTLTIRKLLALPNGVTAAPDETFTFLVTLDGEPCAMQSYDLYASNGELLEADLNTDAAGKLTLAGNQFAVLKKLPLNKDFAVEELLAANSLYTPVGAQKVSGATTDKGAEATFTNAFGNLLVTKQVNNMATQTAPETDTFTFTIKVANAPLPTRNYWLVDANGQKVGEGTTNANGEFTLKDGETALFYGLATGGNYTVSEAGKRYYTQTVPVSAEGYTGTIDDTADRLVFVNEYSRLSTLEITKAVTGADTDASQLFTFHVSIGGASYANKPYVVYGADGYKKVGVYTTTAEGTLTLLADECAVLSGVMPGAAYEVKEVNIPEGYTPEKATMAGKVSIDGSTAAFVNVKEQAPATSTLTISKTVTGNGDTTKGFTFTVTLTDANDAALTEAYAYNGTGVANGRISSGGTITLASGQSIVIAGLPVGAKYVVVENEANQDGYTTTAVGDNGTISVSGASAAFINHKEQPPLVPETSSLTISKTVTGDGNKTKGFIFTVTLTDANDAALTDTYAYTGGNTDNGTIKSGDTFTLADGQSITITGLPVGTRYSIVENEANQDGYTTTSTAATGTIVVGQTASAAFVNHKGIGPAPAYGILTVSKTVTGGGDINALFTFRFTFSEKGSYSYTGSKQGTISTGGFVQLKHGESITITIPQGVTYTVIEDAVTGYVPTPSSRTYTGTITDVESTAAFTNRFDAPYTPPTLTGNLTVEKTVTGDLGDRSKEFGFTIVFNAAGSYAYIGSKTGTISSGDTVLLSHGEYITILNLPAGTTYTVTESGNAGYRTYASGDTGVIIANSMVTASFTNSRSKVPPTGDDNSAMAGLLVMIVSAVGMVSLLLIKKNLKRRRRAQQTR